jgi:carboxymethylenebutenolidase
LYKDYTIEKDYLFLHYPVFYNWIKSDPMKEIKKEDITQEVFDLYDAYAHNRIERRLFLDKLSTYAVGGITVASLLSFISPDYHIIQIQQNDPRLKSDYINYDSPKGGGTIKGLLSKPLDAKDKLPGVIVVHENRGLNPYIEDVGRRAALAGFISLAPDALTPLGGYPGNDDKGRELQSKRDRNEMLEDFIAAYNHLKSHPKCSGKVGVVGFCFGGWISNMMAVRIPDLSAAVPFYGGQPTAEDVPKIKAPLLLHYAGLDTRVNEGWPAYEKLLKENNKEYTAYVYPEVNHGFHNDSTPRFDKAAAELAWQRTVEFFKAKLM